MAREPKPEQKKAFQYLDENPHVDFQGLKDYFIDIQAGEEEENKIKEPTLRTWFKKWKNSQQEQPEHKQEPKQLEGKPKHTSEQKVDDNSDILSFLSGNRDTLEKIIEAFNQEKLNLSDDKAVDIKAPFQAANFLLMKSLFDEFKLVAELQEISQRQAIHRAMKLYIDTFQ